MAEIPFGFRFGIPLGSLPVSPFISTNFHIRNPFYKIDQDVVNFDNWEFIHLLGVGLEITRHFSFEFQWYLGNFGTLDNSPYSNGSSWRLKLEAAL